MADYFYVCTLVGDKCSITNRMAMLRYCKKCLLPDSKPDLFIDDSGVCSACRSYENRNKTDWTSRKIELLDILSKYRALDGSSWDCVIPVSGGKDSTYQVLKMLELGMNPLCVTATTCDLSEIGRKNIENIKSFGVDYIEFSPNKKVRAKLNKIGLIHLGDIAWPEHVGIFTIPVRVATQYRVPLIIWGENSQNEYGGPAAASANKTLDRRWLEEFGGLLGFRVSDLIGMEEIKKKDLIPYLYPSDAELANVGVTGIFLGHFFPWDGFANAQRAKEAGFTCYEKIVEGSAVDYENLDNHQHGIHDYFKFLKFGFGRATDITSLHIRRGLMSREDGLRIVKENEGRFPIEYLGKSLSSILSPLEISIELFTEICDRFTNKKIFKLDSQLRLQKDSHGNLTKVNYDNQ